MVAQDGWDSEIAAWFASEPSQQGDASFETVRLSESIRRFLKLSNISPRHVEEFVLLAVEHADDAEDDSDDARQRRALRAGALAFVFPDRSLRGHDYDLLVAKLSERHVALKSKSMRFAWAATIFRRTLDQSLAGEIRDPRTGMNRRNEFADALVQAVSGVFASVSAQRDIRGVLFWDEPQQDEGLVERRDYLEVLSLWQDAARRGVAFRLFALWGLTGSGKTTLARQFTLQFRPGEVAFFEVGDSAQRREEIRRIFAREKITSAPSDVEFRRHAARLKTISLVVVDDAKTIDDVISITGPVVLPTLVTSQRRFEEIIQDAIEAFDLEVGGLTVEEGEELLEKLLPESSARERRMLGNASFWHPFTINLSARYVRFAHATIEDLVDEMRASETAFSDLAAYLDEPKALHVVVARTIASLSESARAIALLDAIVWQPHLAPIDPRFHRHIVARLAGVETGQLAYDAAAALVERCGLAWREKGFWRMHDLASSILQTMRSPRAHDTIAASHSAIRHLRPDKGDEAIESKLLAVQRRIFISCGFRVGQNILHQVGDPDVVMLAWTFADEARVIMTVDEDFDPRVSIFKWNKWLDPSSGKWLEPVNFGATIVLGGVIGEMEEAAFQDAIQEIREGAPEPEMTKSLPLGELGDMLSEIWNHRRGLTPWISIEDLFDFSRPPSEEFLRREDLQRRRM